MRLVAIGLVAGFFSSLFGVGGGIVIVPLLLLVGWAERPAAATSLLAIGGTALAGVIGYGLLGDLKPGAAALVGIPAAVGVVAGTAVQQRLSGRALRLAFAAFLVAVAIKLLI